MKGGSAWTTHQPLWTGIASARILTYNNIPYMFGGRYAPPNSGWSQTSVSADILAWDGGSKKWSRVGEMEDARKFHGVSAVELNWDTLNACHP